MPEEPRIPQTLPAELVEWTIYLMGESGLMRPQIGLVAALEGTVDAERLSRAVRLAMDAEPVLGSRFVEDDARPIWERIPAIEAFDTFGLEETPDAREAAIAYAARAMHPCLGPQLSARLFRDAEGDVLALRLSHVALDGRAAKECAYLIADLYRRLADDPDFVPAPNVDGVRSLRPTARTAGLADRVRALRPPNPLPPTEWGFPCFGAERGRPMYLTRTLGAPAFRALRAYGRERGATVNDVLLAAYYRVLFDGLGPSNGAATPVQISCDLRDALPSGTTTALANISSVWSIEIAEKRAEPFESTLLRVVERTRAWKASRPGVTAAASLAMAERLLGRGGFARLRARTAKLRASFGASGYPVLTNVGVIEADRLDFGPGIVVGDAFVLGPVAYPPGFVLTASTFRDALTLSAGIDAYTLEPDMAELVLEGVAAESEGLTIPAPSGSALAFTHLHHA